MCKLTSNSVDDLPVDQHQVEFDSDFLFDGIIQEDSGPAYNGQVEYRVRVKGTVQGVGFRPFVWQLAQDCQLSGEVSNDSEGVLIQLSGPANRVHEFIRLLPEKAPPLASIDSIETRQIQEQRQYSGFDIVASRKGQNATQICSDTASCSECLAEINNPDDRHFLYPFTNCTHCGPRLSIIEGTPYDREMTTMSEFPMCSQCRQEYENPADRRFHAQPVACHECGPQIFFESSDKHIPEHTVLEHKQGVSHTRACLEAAVKQLKSGAILAIRGIGGFHLCCDATNHKAVAALRLRKHRYAKPLALMATNLDMVKDYCELSDQEEQHLVSRGSPIVLLNEKARPSAEPLSPKISPGSKTIGFMLPYTPLHSMLASLVKRPLVMTSGNPSGVPQILDNDAAGSVLKDIADAFLFHNRDIANRVDDSVVRSFAGRVRMIRRARGFAPRPMKLPPGFEQANGIIAFGAELKATFCLVKDGRAIVSQHQGDLENVATFEEYEKNLKLYQALYEHVPNCFAIDRHPEYLSSKLARQEALEEKVVEVQHHHAHIASCLVDNNIPLDSQPVLGIAFDGLGYGEDKTFWGGEFLLADYRRFKRVGKLATSPMIGGMKAVLEPWRNTYAQILAVMDWAEFSEKYGHTKLWQYLNSKPLKTIDGMLSRGVNVPGASSCGRLFDAVAGALGLCPDQVSYEGQAAMELEMLVDENLLPEELKKNAYSLSLVNEKNHDQKDELLVLSCSEMWTCLLDDFAQEVPAAVIATRFHAALINGIVSMVIRLKQLVSFDTVALSGGCFQNKVLLEYLLTAIEQHNIQCLIHEQFPANDGGISLGQAAVAAAKMLRPEHDKNCRKVMNKNILMSQL